MTQFFVQIMLSDVMDEECVGGLSVIIRFVCLFVEQGRHHHCMIARLPGFLPTNFGGTMMSDIFNVPSH